MVDLIQFDFNGVAVDSTDHDLRIQRDWDPRIRGLEDFQNLLDENIHDAVDKLGKPSTPFPAEAYLHGLLQIEPIEGFGAMLEDLIRLKKRLLVNTSAGTHNIATYCLAKSLQFHTVLGYDIHRSKGHKSRNARTRFGIEPHRTAFVTDSCGDIHEIRKDSKDIVVIATTYGVHDRKRLERAIPHFIVDTREEMHGVLTKLDLTEPLELRTYPLL